MSKLLCIRFLKTTLYFTVHTTSNVLESVKWHLFSVRGGGYMFGPPPYVPPPSVPLWSLEVNSLKTLNIFNSANYVYKNVYLFVSGWKNQCTYDISSYRRNFIILKIILHRTSFFISQLIFLKLEIFFLFIIRMYIVHQVNQVVGKYKHAAFVHNHTLNNHSNICLRSVIMTRVTGHSNGTPTKRQVSKRQVAKRLVSKRPVSKRPVYKTSSLQNIRFQNVWFPNVWFQNVHRDKSFKTSYF